MVSPRKLFHIIAAIAVPWTTSFGDISEKILAVTQARSKIVWVRNRGNDPFVVMDSCLLMGLDTREGKEKSILPYRSNYNMPLINFDGTRVVFTDLRYPKVYSVNWDGTGLRELCPGWAMDLWHDRETGREWVYVLAGNSPESNTLRRYLLEEPGGGELVWDKTPIEHVQIAADGKRMSACFPWPKCGEAFLPDMSWKDNAEGCWPAIAPDSSGRMWIFKGDHRTIDIFGAGGEKFSTVNLGSAPGMGEWEAYHPRWSNHPEFLTLTGPYTVGDAAYRIPEGGPGVELHLGKFDPSLSKVDKWVQVTVNTQGDFYGDAWVEPRSFSQYPALDFSPQHLDFVVEKGVVFPSSQVIHIDNSIDTLNTIVLSGIPEWLFITQAGKGNSQILTHRIRQEKVGPGVYQAFVKATSSNSGPHGKTYSVKLIVKDFPILHTLDIVPKSAMIQVGDTYAFKAKAKDQFGQDLYPQPDFIWTVSDGQTVDNETGLFMAGPLPGIHTIRVMASRDDSLKSDSAKITLYNPKLALILNQPKGGEKYRIGDTLHVLFLADSMQTSGVNIELSLDGGLKWTHIKKESINPGETDWEHFRWRIPESLSLGSLKVSTESNACRVRISDYFNPNSLNDKSEGVFSIGSPVGLTPWDNETRLSLIRSGHRMVVKNNHDREYILDIQELDGRRISRNLLRSGESIYLSGERPGLFVLKVWEGEFGRTVAVKRVVFVSP